MDNFIEYYKCGGKTKTPSKPKKVKSCACGSKIKKSGNSKKSTKSAKLKIAAKGMKMKGCGCGSKLYRVGGRIVEMDCNNIIKAQKGDTINYVTKSNPSLENNESVYKTKLNPLITAIQKSLKSQGLNPGPIDGIMGPKTKKALKRREQKNTMLRLDPSISTLDIKSSEKKPTVPVVEDLNERPDLLSDEIYMPGNRLSYRSSPLEY